MSILETFPDLQQYKRVHHRRHKTDKLLVTIYKQAGSINLSETSYIALGRPKHLVLYYSQEKHTLLIQRASENDPSAIKVYQRGRCAIYFVNVRQFCLEIGIDLKQTRRYQAELQDDVLVVDLGKEDDGIN